jgi:hypothetical protein
MPSQHSPIAKREADNMEIKKIIVDRLSTSCMPCLLKHSHDCGTLVKKQETSSGARIEKKPDDRCKLRTENDRRTM